MTTDLSQKLIDNLVSANSFTLSNKLIQVSFSSTSFAGVPLLNYCDPDFHLSFFGDEIRIVESEIGELVTVTLENIPDLRIVTFTLILPIVKVLQDNSFPINIAVPGLITTTPMNFGGFPMIGQQRTYRQVFLNGPAQFLVF